MKQYEYVSVHIGKLFGAASEEHREIINDYAAKGWRYVGFIPTVSYTHLDVYKRQL